MEDERFPIGLNYIAASAKHQDRCEIQSRRVLLNQLPKTLETTVRLGSVLSLGDRLASCYWGCHGKEHVVEYLVGRTVSNAYAAMRLIEFGHYDEALALVRNIFEIGNLTWLFFVEPSDIRRWLDLPEKKRRSTFSALEVRRKLESLDSVTPHHQGDYSDLSEVAVHPNPKTTPQAHNHYGIPTLGGYYQQQGQIICINKLAWAVASVVGPAAKIAILERERAEEIVRATIELTQSTLDTEHIEEKETDLGAEYLRRLTEQLDKERRHKGDASQ